MREWRRTHRLTVEQRLKANARSITHVYIKRGKIGIEGCRICGKEAEIHHLDYTQPLVVEWLCREHHLDLHIAKRFEGNVARGTFSFALIKEL